MSLSRILGVAAVAALVAVGVAGADGTQLAGTVGPGFTIGLTDASGAPVTHLDPGTFTLNVDDKSDEHNFHLVGPGGVDASTDVDAIETKTFSLTLVDGKYTFYCDAHPTRMRGTFTVGTVAPTPPPPVAPTRLVLTVTGKAVTLTSPAGKAIRALSVGPALISVRDRSATRGARLSGAGVSRSTAVRFVGTVTWKVKLAAGTLVFASDARKPVLHGGRVKVS